MTLTAATGPRPTTSPAHLRDFRPAARLPRDPGPGLKMPMRSYEIAALRGDGSLYIGQDKAPAVPLFENAFSAFARGTLIATPRGPVAIEDLQPGDMVNTGDGEEARVNWIGSSSFVPADAGRRMPLVRIMADAFGVGRPSSFITLGPAARILHTPHRLRAEAGEQRLLTPVHEFADGVNVIRVVPPTPVRLFHICLERHATVIAGGIEMETYHPGTVALHSLPQGLRERFLGMFPLVGEVADFGPLAHPRAPEVRAEADAH
ncbi:Hint domain-containing protein [Marimonas sp. MJW-29]|uniref:Hint domain-containing protein n=1 Tax=Sulfitobacter sediminis TaxID=3234186 RepID=A0ABV3RKW5_9RHOB